MLIMVKGKNICVFSADTYRAPKIYAPQLSDAV